MNIEDDYNIKYINGLYLVCTCFFSLDEEYQNPDGGAPVQNIVHTEQSMDPQKVVEVAVLLMLL